MFTPFVGGCKAFSTVGECCNLLYMPVQNRILLAVAAAALIAVPASAATISGSIFDDTRALANRADFTPLSGVAVHVYRDGGDGSPDGKDDTAAGDAVTTANGEYSVTVANAGLYWVVADSHSIKPAGAWAEQTYGAIGALCENGSGVTRQHVTAGPCYGGRTTASDNARSLATSEHLIAARALSADATNAAVDFAFSFDVVTTVRDGDDTQGSLRQFLANANAVSGANTMRFVPLEPVPPATNRQPQHWTIHLTKPLGNVRDEGTAFNGTAYRFTTGTPVAFARQELEVRDDAGAKHPEIDLVVELTGDDGIVFDKRGSIRSIELDGAKTAVRANAELTIERAVIEGVPPAGEGAESTTIDGIVATHGMLVMNNAIVAARSRYGVIVEGDATLDASESEFSECGSTTTGGAIVLRTSGSTIGKCAVHRNGGIGIEVDAPSNTIDSSRINDNWIGIVLRDKASDTTIARNDLVWNRSGAIVGAEAKSGPAKHNRITRNHFNENGGETIAVGQIVEDETQRRTPACNPNANGTIDPPYIERASKSGTGDNATIEVEGIACPNATVELYTSFVTGRLRQRIQTNERDLYSVREALKTRNVVETRDYRGLNVQRLPSVGEFNYAGVATADANGRFKTTIPWPLQSSLTVTAMQNTGGLAVAAVSIDPIGDTSPFSGRKMIARP